MRERLFRAGERLKPSPRAWRGAAVTLLVAALLVWLWATLPQLAPATLPFSLLVSGLDLLIAALTGAALLLILGLLGALPRLYRWALFSAAVLLATLGAGPSQRGWFLAVGGLIVCASIAGGVLWSLVGGGWSRMGRASRALSLGGLLAGLLVLALGAYWLLSPGPATAQIPNAAAQGGAPAPLGLPDPSESGPFSVQQLTYGSGSDRQRPEYGAEVTLETEPVDASAIVKGWQGIAGDARTRFWGFDQRALPLNGRVWYPEGQGPFPLVLIVHGNSRAEGFSDAGFAYLGELLASRGFIAASVDENFLNTGLIDTLGGLEGAGTARGWLLLEHLRVWHAWNEQPGNPFLGKIDTANIALVGHSRGGEAVAVAAALNRLAHLPDDATVTLSYGYNLRSLIALAPSDGQYTPLGDKLPLENINYLTLQGSHDADVISFAGLNQLHRTRISGDGDFIKAALYIYRANHSQFNTTWDRFDVGDGLAARFIDTAALLPGDQQRKVAQVYISAFVEATLRGENGYLPLFRDPALGRAWLPDTVYLGQYADSRTQYISTFEEDLDVASTTLVGGSQRGEQLEEWHEEHLPLRLGPGDDRAARLSWLRGDGASEPRFTVTLPASGIQVGATNALHFDLADTGAAPAASGVPSSPAAEPLDLTIEVQDAAGNVAQLPLSHISPLQPPIQGRYLKSALLQDAPLSEPIMQTYRFPLADFAAANSTFDAARLASVAFVFNATPAGSVLLDDIGVAAGE